MTNIRYAGDEPSTEAFGKTFIAGEWTDESGLDAYALETLRTNPQFMVTDDKPGKAAKVEAEPAPVEAATAGDEPAVEAPAPPPA